ncbi:MAG: branched-chain amino acid aminotransferase [Phycisphaerae bacterium SM23_33]|nr:MAG: branched-chain amino acid aminotransferase [Phycisphaerae bacterium SM23_33]
MKVWLNGKLVDKAKACVSVFDHGLLYGDGVFEGIRVYNGTIFQCEAHLDRLFASAEAIRLPIPMTRQEITRAMQQAMRANQVREGYIRLVVTRGAGTLGLGPFDCSGGSVFIIADQVALYPQQMYEDGLAVVIARHRRISPDMLPPAVKSLNYLNNILAKIEAIDAGAGEALMLNAQGELSEATGDNIFIVRDGIVLTPPPEAGVLVGITRKVVMDLCRELGVPLEEKPLTAQELLAADEAFLTGTAAEVIAIARVDGKPIGTGKSGPITRKLLAAFRDFIRAECGGGPG